MTIDPKHSQAASGLWCDNLEVAMSTEIFRAHTEAWEKLVKEYPYLARDEAAEMTFRRGFVDGANFGLNFARAQIEPAASDLRRILEGV